MDKEAVQEKKNFKEKSADYKGEFKRIIWPSREELKKHTLTVIITCILFGIVIFIMDLAFNQGIELFVKLMA